MSKRPTGSLLSLGVPELTEFTGCLPFFGRESGRVTAVGHVARATVLDDLVQDVQPRPCVHQSDESTREAIANERYECSTTCSGNSTLNSSVAKKRVVSCWNGVQPAQPES